MNTAHKGLGIAAVASALAVAGLVAVSGTANADSSSSQGVDNAEVRANVAVVQSFVQTVLNQHRDATPFLTTDAQWYGGTAGTVTGGAYVGGLFDSVTVALPDLHADVVDIFGQGDQVVMHVVVSGTQEKAILGIPASGRHVQWDGIDIFQITDGKISHITAGDDWTAILNDTGTYKAPWSQ